jgi:hypothetical protein
VAISVGNGFDPDGNGCIGYRRGAGSYVNHQVIFIGAKVVDGQVWWLMKNSWGEWGAFGDGTAWLVEDSGSDSYGWVGDDVDLDFWVIVRMTAADTYQFDSPLSSAPVKQAAPKMTTPATKQDRAADGCDGGSCGVSNGRRFRR